MKNNAAADFIATFALAAMLTLLNLTFPTLTTWWMIFGLGMLSAVPMILVPQLPPSPHDPNILRLSATYGAITFSVIAPMGLRLLLMLLAVFACTLRNGPKQSETRKMFIGTLVVLTILPFLYTQMQIIYLFIAYVCFEGIITLRAQTAATITPAPDAS